MNSVLVLALVLVAGLAATRLSRVTHRLANLRLVRAAGAPLLLIGVVLGPATGVVNDAVLDALAPITALAIGWTGAAFGARIQWRLVRRIPRRIWALAAIHAGASFLAVAGGAAALAVLVPALRTAWQPLAVVALALGAIAAVARAGHAVPTRLARAATLETAFGATAFTLVLAADHSRGPLGGPVGAAGWLVLALGGGVLVGLLFLGLARLRDPEDFALTLLGTVLFGAGLGFAAGLSPFVICAIAAAIVVNRSPKRRLVARWLAAWESPIYVAFMILAGAALGGGTLWLVPAALMLAAVRVLARWGVSRLAKDASFLGLAGVPQGGVALALALNFFMNYRGPAAAAAGSFVTVVVIAVVLSQLAAPYVLTRLQRPPQLTSSPAPAEVS